MKRLIALSVSLGLGLACWAASASAAPIATSPPCGSPFDPYAYTQAAVASCPGIKTFALQSVTPMTGGGSEYTYDVDGALYHYYVPPAGFDALTATAAQLNEYGLPPQPTDLIALEAWDKQMANLHVVTPPPFLVEIPATAGTVYNSHWSGYVVEGSGFTHAETWYYEPSDNSSACSTKAEVTWAGVGGWYTGTLAQNGTYIGNALGGMSEHQAWSEVLPSQNIMAQNFHATAGYEFDASTRWLGGSWRFYFYNYYNATTLSYDVGINEYDGSSAEGIAERPELNGSFTNLANFATLTFQNTYANGTAINNFTHDGIHMTGNGLSGGKDMADPSGLGSGGYFTDTQHSCSP